jgi:hypothetical protein
MLPPIVSERIEKKNRKIHRYAKQKDAEKNALTGGALPPKSCDFGTPVGVPPNLTKGQQLPP